jgi:hypothetical protein
VANSLIREREKGTMRESGVQIGNSELNLENPFPSGRGSGKRFGFCWISIGDHLIGEKRS